MSDEVQILTSLLIRKVDSTDPTIVLVEYHGQPINFVGDLIGSKGPVPGSIAVSVAGVDVDFSELATPGYCRLMNQDPTNFVEFGIWDPEGARFYPLGEILPGETYVLRLSRNLNEEYGTGTGTAGANTNRLRFKANTASCNVLVEAFES